MERGMPEIDPAIGRDLVLDELFDLTLYQRFAARAEGKTKTMLEELVGVETGHLNFWRKLFGLSIDRLDLGRRVKLAVVLFLARVFGESGIHLVLEAIEVYGIRKYLSLWETHRDDAFGAAVRPILEDEMGHEDEIVTSGTTRRIHPERIRDLFLGFNDGLVEVLGAASGFFAAFGTASSVLVAGATVAVAGSLSMAAGAYAAVGSAAEIERTEARKKSFLEGAGGAAVEEHPLASAVVVGVSYFVGALVPLAPVFFGSENLVLSVVVSGLVAVCISYLVAFLSGMNVARRIGINLVAVAVAVGVTYAIGALAKSVWGVAI